MKARKIEAVQFLRIDKRRNRKNLNYHILVDESKHSLGVDILFNIKDMPKNSLVVAYRSTVSKEMLKNVVTTYLEKLKLHLDYEIPADLVDSESD
jgi:hypothetical protein